LPDPPAVPLEVEKDTLSCLPHADAGIDIDGFQRHVRIDLALV
jgi:hypothetical protein